MLPPLLPRPPLPPPLLLQVVRVKLPLMRPLVLRVLQVLLTLVLPVMEALVLMMVLVPVLVLLVPLWTAVAVRTNHLRGLYPCLCCDRAARGTPPPPPPPPPPLVLRFLLALLRILLVGLLYLHWSGHHRHRPRKQAVEVVYPQGAEKSRRCLMAPMVRCLMNRQQHRYRRRIARFYHQNCFPHHPVLDSPAGALMNEAVPASVRVKLPASQPPPHPAASLHLISVQLFVRQAWVLTLYSAPAWHFT